MTTLNENKVLTDNQHFGFLGSGKMAQAISKGLLSSGILKGSQITMTDRFGTSLEDATFYQPIKAMIETYGIEYMQTNKPMVKKSDVIFVCVKPNFVQQVLQECSTEVADKLVISIAAGITVNDLEKSVPASTRVIRIMPNTPCMFQQGVAIYTRGAKATEKDGLLMKTVLSTIFPLIEEIPEYQMNAATALSGSGPAYILMVIEALSDGGVRLGLTRALSQALAIQTVLGTAVMAKESGVHPAQLRDEVCSPGGSSIAGTHVLEMAGVRATFSDCIQAAKKRNDELAAPKK